MSFDTINRKFFFFSNVEQWNKFKRFVIAYFTGPKMILVMITLILCFVFIFAALKRKKVPQKYRLFKLLALACYFLTILILSVFSRNFGTVRELRITFDPWFAGDNSFHESNILISLINCLYFIPFGILLRWQNKKRFFILITFLIIILTSLFVEGLQYLLMCGVASISDAVSYIIGGIIGAAVMSIAQAVSCRHKTNVPNSQ